MSVEFHIPAVLFPWEEPTVPIGLDCGWATACILSFVGLKTEYPLTNHCLRWKHRLVDATLQNVDRYCNSSADVPQELYRVCRVPEM